MVKIVRLAVPLFAMSSVLGPAFFTTVQAQDLTVDQVRDNLRRQVQARDGNARPDGQATRGIKINNSTGDYIGDPYTTQTQPGTATATAAPPAPQLVRPLQFQVAFELNSFRLTSETKRTLAVVAEALRDPQLSDRSWQVIGHTDALGSARHNQTLSENRAESVVDGLELLGARARLVPLGRGESQLLAGEAPDSPANRRVEIRIAD